jgi:hypothetical protein
VTRDRLARAVTRRTGVSEGLAERIARLADLSDAWKRRLEALPGGHGGPSLTEVLTAARLE